MSQAPVHGAPRPETDRRPGDRAPARYPPSARAGRSLDEVTTDYVPGDVVHIPAGPFRGVCAVVREVDPQQARLRVDAVVSGGPHGLVVGFDEVEWA